MDFTVLLLCQSDLLLHVHTIECKRLFPICEGNLFFGHWTVGDT